MVMVAQGDSLKVCTTIVPMCWTTHGDMKQIEDDKSDDGDVGEVAAKRRSWW
jgi:hypothetical protein